MLFFIGELPNSHVFFFLIFIMFIGGELHDYVIYKQEAFEFGGTCGMFGMLDMFHMLDIFDIFDAFDTFNTFVLQF